MGFFRESPKFTELRLKLSDREDERQKSVNAYNAQRDAELGEGAVKWQYRAEDDLSNVDMNKLGIVGWELVSAVSYVTGLGLGHTKVSEVHMRYVFKRKLREDADYSQELHDARDNVSALDQEIATIKAEIEALPKSLL